MQESKICIVINHCAILEPYQKYNGDQRELFMEAGQNCEEQFEHCSLNAFTNFPCCSMLQPIFDRINGRCHLFEGKNLNQKQIGNGLKVLMKFKRNVMIPHTNRPGTAVGAAVRIQQVYDPIDMQDVLIPPGHIVKISLQVSGKSHR